MPQPVIYFRLSFSSSRTVHPHEANSLQIPESTQMTEWLQSDPFYRVFSSCNCVMSWPPVGRRRAMPFAPPGQHPWQGGAFVGGQPSE